MVAETMNGATTGATAGSAFGPWGAVGGAVLGGIGGYLSGKSKKKAAKKKLQMMQDALNQFKAGSTDALGNTLSANNAGRWSYNLGIGGQQAANAANRANIIAGTTAPKSRSEIVRDNFNANHLGMMLNARANQAAAMRAGMRTNSNIGNIANALARQTNNNLLQNYSNALMQGKNNSIYNANITNNLANAATNAANPINNIQNNLQQMVQGLNLPVMNQMNAIAGAASNPYLNGQGTADLFKGLGGMTSAYAQNQQEAANFDKLYQLLLAKYNK
jgi:hypothetical protein